MVDCLEGPNGLVTDQKGMLDVALGFYKTLFGAESREKVKLGEGFWAVGDLVTNEENEMLKAHFSEKEIKEAVFSCYSDGAPGPDGLSFLFYQKFWEVIKEDLVDMFDDLYKGELDLYRLNFAL